MLFAIKFSMLGKLPFHCNMCWCRPNGMSTKSKGVSGNSQQSLNQPRKQAKAKRKRAKDYAREAVEATQHQLQPLDASGTWVQGWDAHYRLPYYFNTATQVHYTLCHHFPVLNHNERFRQSYSFVMNWHILYCLHGTEPLILAKHAFKWFNTRWNVVTIALS